MPNYKKDCMSNEESLNNEFFFLVVIHFTCSCCPDNVSERAHALALARRITRNQMPTLTPASIPPSLKARTRPCCIRSLSPISRCCFGAASAASARLLISTRDFSGPRLRRCSLLSLMPIQLPKNLPLKKRGKCTAGSACSSAATNAASCLPPIMAHLPSSAHALPDFFVSVSEMPC